MMRRERLSRVVGNILRLRPTSSFVLDSHLTFTVINESVSQDYEPLQARFYNFYLPGSPSNSHGYLSGTRTNMDTCPKCKFGAIRPYTPSVDANGLLRSGVSPFHISRASLLNDIANLEQELQDIEPLFIQIRDRRNKLLKDLGDCKAFLSPVRTLPPETLLHIFELASSYNDPLEAPWMLGHVCSFWRSLSRSCPSLWRRVYFAAEYCTPEFLEEYISLSRDLPIQLYVFERPDVEDVMAIFEGLMMHSERWSTLELHLAGEHIYELLNLASSPAVQLTKLHISLRVGSRVPKLSREVMSNLFSSSPIQDAYLPRISYSRMPIHPIELRKFHIFSSSAELYYVLQHAPHLTDLTVTCQGLRPSSLPPTYSDMSHAVVRKLSFFILGEIQESIDNIEFPFGHATLPALQQFEILLDEQIRRLLGEIGTLDHSGMVGFLHRSQCNLTTITLDVPMAVETFLLPILTQSPALQRLHVFVNASVARDVFEVLVSERGLVQHLKELSIVDLPIPRDQCCLFKESDTLHRMILSRSGSDRCLETLRLSLTTRPFAAKYIPLPVAPDSPFRDLFRIRDQGMDIKFLFDGMDCLVDEKVRAAFFGSL